MAGNNTYMDRVGGMLDSLGIVTARKADGTVTTGNSAVGDFMDRAQVEQLVDLTVSTSGWLAGVQRRFRRQRRGEIPRMRINEVVTRGVDENEGASPTKRPSMDTVEYDARKFQASYQLTRESIREARASGEANFEAKMAQIFTRAVGNDLARAFMNGDTSLPASSDLNRLLRRRDGVIKKARATANRQTTTYGTAYDDALWSAVKNLMPEEYRDDPDLRWMVPSALDESWQASLAARSGDVGSALGDRASIERTRMPILGIPQTIVPQMSTEQGFSTLRGDAGVPDTVVDDGDGTATITVNSVLGGYAAAKAGRYVRVTFTETGLSERLVVEDIGGALKVRSRGSFGQSSISTTASGYSVDVADCASVFLTNPANFCLVMCDDVRATKQYEPEFERWRIDLFFEADFLIFNEDALVIQDGVVPRSFTWGS